jgi:Flp pilus assembly pilin Flp
MFSPLRPLGLLVLVMQARLQRAEREQRGASAVEWVVIAAIVVGICVAVGLVIQNALEGKAGDIEDEIGGA